MSAEPRWCAPRSQKCLLDCSVRIEGRCQHPVAVSVKLGGVRLDETTGRVFISLPNGIVKLPPTLRRQPSLQKAIPAVRAGHEARWSGGDEFRARPRLYRVRRRTATRRLTMTEGSDREFAVPPPDPELRGLEPWCGPGGRRITHTQNSVYGPGVPVRITRRSAGSRAATSWVQEYETIFGDEPAQRDINYWYYDSEVERFLSSSSATTDRSPKTGIGIRARSRRGSSRSSGRLGSSTSSTRKGRSRRPLTARSRSHGGYGTSGASGSPG